MYTISFDFVSPLQNVYSNLRQKIIKINRTSDFYWFDTAQLGCQNITKNNFVKKSSFYATRRYHNCQNTAVKLEDLIFHIIT